MMKGEKMGQSEPTGSNWMSEVTKLRSASPQPPVLSERFEAIDLWHRGCDELKELDVAAIIHLITQLLLDEGKFTVRIACARQLYQWFRDESDAADFLYGDVSAYLRELWWIASAQLFQAISKDVVNRHHIGRLLLHPTALEVARRMVGGGEVAFDQELREAVEKRQSETWNWLRDEAEAGRLNARAEGKYVAAYKRESTLDEVIVGENPVDVARIGAERWLIPKCMVAVTFVSSEVNL